MGAFGNRTTLPVQICSNNSGLVRDGAGPAVVDGDASAIVAGLRRELERLRLTHDTSCICVASPDCAGGQEAIEDFGRRFARRLRSYDAIYRFAPDKYLVMLPHIGRGDAVRVIKRLREQVVAEPFRIADGRKLSLTASFGGTMLDCKTALHEHLDRASEAHDWALKGMGDSICIWTPQL